MARKFFDKIKFARGQKQNMPQLQVGEPAFATDEESLYIGTPNGNKKIADTFSDHEVVVTYHRRKINNN